MKQETNKKKTVALTVLLLFVVFAACVLGVLLTGAEAYSGLTRRDQHSYDRRTAAQYLTVRLHQGDRQGGVQVRSFGDGDALVFTEQIGGAEYETMVYCHDGYLWERFAAAGAQLPADAGERVLQAQRLTVDCNGNLCTLRLTDLTGTEQVLAVCLRSTQEVEP